ncbi:hypothetical protein ACVDFE_15695 [Lentzea chajnantorensis]
MAAILGVHGIWCDQATGPATQREWTERVRIGLQENHHPDPHSVEVRVAYYGHLYLDGKGTTGITADDPEDLDEFEQEILFGMVEAAGIAPAGSGQDKLGLPSSFQTALRGLVNTPFFGSATTSGVLWLIKQVRRYFADTAFRAAVHREIEIAMEDDTKVVVAHSLGSVAAYEALRAHPEWPARTLITLGSPLGLPGIMKRISPALSRGNEWPGSVRTWVNVAAKEDPVALVKKLRTPYDRRIDDRPAINTIIRGHDASQYLRNLSTATALIDALR